MKETAFAISFIITGCGIDSAFTSQGAFVVWAVALAVLGVSAFSIITE